MADAAWTLRPGLVLRGLVLLATAGGLILLLLVLRIPIASVSLADPGGGKVEIAGEGRRLVLPATVPVFFSNGTNMVSLPASALMPFAEPGGTRAENAADRAARDRIAAMLAAGPVEMRVADVRIKAQTRPHAISDLDASFWIPFWSGMAMLLAGLWVWALRPASGPARMFALSGAGFFVGCGTLAILADAGLGAGGSAGRVYIAVNYAGGLAVGFALVAIFARFPRSLVARPWLTALALLSLAAELNLVFEIAPGAIDLCLALASADCLAVAVLIGLQAWRSRRDPSERAALLPVAIGTGIASSAYCLLAILPQIGGHSPPISPALATPILLLIFLGLGLAITRARLFALGQWAVRLLLSTGTIILVLLLEPLIVSGLMLRRDLAFAIAGLAAVALYLVVRDAIVRQEERVRARRTQRLLALAGDIAFAPSGDAAAAVWRDVVRTMFAPLEVESCAVADDCVSLSPDRTGLQLPLPEVGETLRLAFPGGGARLFTAEDRLTADRYRTIVRQLVEARDSYFRGVTEERQRIARDLHDDVSARLLTSLHRTEPGPMREDIRSAMADIRSIVAGLTGEAEPIDAILADLRHEMQTRLEAAGIALDWPLDQEMGEARLIDHGRYRNLLSVMRETISNAIRHSGATIVRVAVAYKGETLLVAISDDGRGVGGAGAGNGMINAARRAEALGGSYRIEDGVRGTVATLIFPLPRSGEGRSAHEPLEPAAMAGEQ